MSALQSCEEGLTIGGSALSAPLASLLLLLLIRQAHAIGCHATATLPRPKPAERLSALGMKFLKVRWFRQLELLRLATPLASAVAGTRSTSSEPPFDLKWSSMWL